MDIKQMIAQAAAGSSVALPSGEFEGPLIISKPLRLIGKNTTIWAKRSPVIEINSNGVSIENILCRGKHVRRDRDVVNASLGELRADILDRNAV